jgi:hypothetical protein
MRGGDLEREKMVFQKKRVDLDQRAVIARLEEMGFSVLNLSAVGHGCPDLLVGKDGKNFLLEIKSKNGTLTPAQIEFHKNWKGHSGVVKLQSLGDFLNGAT